MTEDKIYKCAIFGFGYMGEIRKRVIDEHPKLQLDAICDAAPSKVPTSDEYVVTANADDVWNRNIDIAFVATPNNLIPPITVKALNQKIHVFCEKPPGRTLADIEKMQEAEKANATTKLMFGFNHRYHPAVQKAKAIIESGILGKLLSMRGNYGKSGGRNFKNSWRNDKEISGGGILLDQGIHMLDLFNFFAGDFKDVKAIASI